MRVRYSLMFAGMRCRHKFPSYVNILIKRFLRSVHTSCRNVRFSFFKLGITLILNCQ
uniref:Uncharacterized protein n=1 Tax=Arundo donax TaxID=35708 RepID=A0A0A9E6I3_ARUDO